ncbi:MAG: Adaptive-response sensory-kinase SasA [Phycisphaerae bacterium]|nr:Adaptive-response sensory-kinase SasA [Phycisphaerae bacterium]
MRSLFLKIFLWFWAANIVVVGVLALSAWVYPPEGVPPGLNADKLHELQVRGALAVLERDGLAAFERHLDELHDASALHTYWLDERGAELRGALLPAPLQEFVAAHRAESERGQRVVEGFPPRLMILPLTDSHGRKYRVLIEAFWRGPRFQFPIQPGVLALRALAVVLAAGLGCYALARYLSAPVRRLQQVVRRLASGDLTVRVDEEFETRRDEIGQLGRDFDRMTRQVQALLGAQRRLLQDVSHELRSPLARLNVALELARRQSSDTAGAALDRIERESARLNELIGLVLTLARLESGAPPEAPAAIDLAELLREVAADADFEGAPRGRRVVVRRADACTLRGSAPLIRSVFENVLRNAVRFTPDGTAVDVCLERRKRDAGGAYACTAVRDHGPGVPESQLETIFQPFFRVEEARARRVGGVGLGLAICDRAVRLHDGTLRAENADGGGLRVTIELPCDDATAD